MTPAALRTALWPLALVLGAGACRGTSAPVAPPRTAVEERVEAPAGPRSVLTDPSFHRLESRGGGYTLCWRPVTGSVPRNANFDLEVWLFAGDEPAPGAELFVRGWMPDHGHGMLHQPRTVDGGDGSYRVTGMLLHMRGHWQVYFDIVRNGQADVAECELDL